MDSNFNTRRWLNQGNSQDSYDEQMQNSLVMNIKNKIKKRDVKDKHKNQHSKYDKKAEETKSKEKPDPKEACLKRSSLLNSIRNHYDNTTKL